MPAAGFTPPKEIKGPQWKAAMNLSVRKAGEAKFGDATKKVGVELFLDPNDGARIYISETGSIAIVSGGPAGASAAAPKHQYGYELRVRKGTEGDFTEQTKKYGIEVFKDEAGGTLLYVSETGAIAARPAAAVKGGGEARRPDWLFGLNLKVRKAGEKDFTDTTHKWGIEVFKDEKTDNLIYVTENGDLAIVPAGASKRPEETKNPTWLRAQEVRVRRGGEKEFTDTTRKWGIEVFRDENTGNSIYITEAGAVAVLPPK
jgi:putative component of toxin-antitoxin plasmid stabilization module